MADSQLTEQDEKKKAEAAKAAEADKVAKAKAEADKKKAAAAEKAEGKAFFRSHFSGLTVRKKDGSTVRFTPYWDMFKGDRVKVGYFETNDPEVIEILRKDSNVEKISSDDFEKGVKNLDTAPIVSE